ncbi:MAG: hypothetical protein MR357_06035 [Anaeroplasma sp.]|nr:hypothetical protein [Anaeroplasma sp.]
MKRNNILLLVSILGFILIAIGSIFICSGSIINNNILLIIGLALVLCCIIIEIIVFTIILIKFYKSYR